ncbi:hypothetical protein PM085_15825 [Halorubrum ezzemoulense]|uniref:Uncharacterized protein n=1 Tax=Halorubrum ezzemoulense TaxID=337243 RepID=A0ABT4Z852_HALEZ|nr:hypothetical protein [Halorubrum ezzemoulense]MDB2293726.1 hypothetical protein [Halorubrum ezzemoulense]
MASKAIGDATASIQSSGHYQTGKDLGNQLFARIGDEAFGDLDDDMAHAKIMGTVRVILGAMIGLAVGIVVLNEVFSLQSVSNSTGPFSEVITQIENIGGAALGLIVIGLLVAAANQIMSFFGGGGF